MLNRIINVDWQRLKLFNGLLKLNCYITIHETLNSVYPVGWGYRINRLLLCRGEDTPNNVCPGYDIKQSNGEVPVMLELWGIRSTPLLLSLPGPLWPGLYLHLNCALILKWIVWNWTVFDIETVLSLNWIVIYRTVLTFYFVNKICTHTKLNYLY